MSYSRGDSVSVKESKRISLNAGVYLNLQTSLKWRKPPRDKYCTLYSEGWNHYDSMREGHYQTWLIQRTKDSTLISFIRFLHRIISYHKLSGLKWGTFIVTISVGWESAQAPWALCVGPHRAAIQVLARLHPQLEVYWGRNASRLIQVVGRNSLSFGWVTEDPAS